MKPSVNRINSVLYLAAFATLGMLTRMAGADSLRCGNNLVGMEDGKAEVIQKCGQPTFTDAFCRYDYLPGVLGWNAICRQVDLWTYNLGPGTLLKKVEFEQGRIIRISNGDRVR